MFRTVAPCHRRNAKNDYTHDCGVGLPIGGLRIPASCWRPNMLRVPCLKLRAWALEKESSSGRAHGILPPLECETEAPFDGTVLIEWSASGDPVMFAVDVNRQTVLFLKARCELNSDRFSGCLGNFGDSLALENCSQYAGCYNVWSPSLNEIKRFIQVINGLSIGSIVLRKPMIKVKVIKLIRRGFFYFNYQLYSYITCCRARPVFFRLQAVHSNVPLDVIDPSRQMDCQC